MITVGSKVDTQFDNSVQFQQREECNNLNSFIDYMKKNDILDNNTYSPPPQDNKAPKQGAGTLAQNVAQSQEKLYNRLQQQLNQQVRKQISHPAGAQVVEANRAAKV